MFILEWSRYDTNVDRQGRKNLTSIQGPNLNATFYYPKSVRNVF